MSRPSITTSACAAVFLLAAGLTAAGALTPDEELGRATDAHQYIRSQGFAGGSSLGGAVLLLVVATQTGDVEVVRELLAGAGEGGPAGGSDLGAGVAGAVRDGFATAALVCAGVAVVAHAPLRAVRRAARRAEQTVVTPASDDAARID